MVLEKYSTCSLEEAGRVQFERREDTKYLGNSMLVQQILDDLHNDYFVLAINDEALLPYITSYFDTTDDSFYLKHHNKNYERYKFRRRYYPASGDRFFEVKVKSNKKITTKHRLAVPNGSEEISPEEYDFLSNVIKDKPSEYFPAVTASFKRITLVKKDFKERCTIDTSLTFTNGDNSETVEDLVILEVKNEMHVSSGPIRKALRENSIRQMNFSKYCIGRALLDPSLKQNNFKETINYINNHIHK